MLLIAYLGDVVKIALRQPYKQFFGTLANQVRIDIITVLDKKEMSVNAIVHKLNYDQSTISHSLKRLESCGFVSVNQRGKNRIYSLNKITIVPLLKLMNSHMKNYCSKIVMGKC